MGNYNSGRGKWPNAKLLTTDLNRISPKQLPIKYGEHLHVDQDTEQGRAFIDYRQIDEDFGELRLAFGNVIQGRCNIHWLPMNFGNRRAWFECWFCEKRVGHLYAYGPAMRCRNCANMAYKSQRLSKASRSLDQAHKLRRKHGFQASLEDQWIKPKGMHWKTFDRIKSEYGEKHSAGFGPVVGFLGYVLKNQKKVKRQLKRAHPEMTL